jgi:hypothetical protein
VADRARLGAGLIGCCLLWWRRRWPVHIAVAAGADGGVLGVLVGAGALALFTVAVHRRFSVVAVVTAIGFAVLPIYILIHPRRTTRCGCRSDSS